MLKKYLVVYLGVFCAMILCAGSAHAGKGGGGSGSQAAQFKHADRTQKATSWWKRQADKDADGSVSNEERARWKETAHERMDLDGDGTISSKEKRLSWRHGKSKVNKPVEERYDADRDGFLQPQEVKAMLQDKYGLIKTRGRARVNSDIEKAYDGNNDGIIDGQEAEALKADTE